MYEVAVGFTCDLSAQPTVQPTVLHQQLPPVVTAELMTLAAMDAYSMPVASTPDEGAHCCALAVGQFVMPHAASVAPGCASATVAFAQGSPLCVYTPALTGSTSFAPAHGDAQAYPAICRQPAVHVAPQGALQGAAALPQPPCAIDERAKKHRSSEVRKASDLINCAARRSLAVA